MSTYNVAGQPAGRHSNELAAELEALGADPSAATLDEIVLALNELASAKGERVRYTAVGGAVHVTPTPTMFHPPRIEVKHPERLGDVLRRVFSSPRTMREA